MMAYVFWHAPQLGVTAAAYENGLAAFHQSLARHRPEGFRASVSRRFGGLPWLEGELAYEDWYLVDDFGSLGVLNSEAVMAARGEAHDHVAAYSACGTGSIYALEAGVLEPDAETAHWFDRPDGLATPSFLREIRSIARNNGATLWRRQLSLGPATEYCLHARGVVDLAFPSTHLIPERRLGSAAWETVDRS